MKLSLDSHKLLFHLSTVNKWLRGEEIYPIYCAISPTQNCNYRCIFCVYDTLKRQNVFIDTDNILKIIKELHDNGLKALFFSGEGEPLLHHEIDKIIHKSKSFGVDCALNTNGYFLKKELSQKILKDLTFVRISLNGCTSENYQKIHRTHLGAYNRILKNLRNAVRIKKRDQLGVTLGVQCIILNENVHLLSKLAEDLKFVGVDYLALKPFLSIGTTVYRTNLDLNNRATIQNIEKCEAVSDSDFQVIVRWNSIKKMNKRPYNKCLSLPFMVEIDSKGDVYPCGVLLGRNEYSYGNINDQSYKELINSERYKKTTNMIYKNLDVHSCMPNCRNDAVNRFLWDLKHPPVHVNFI